MTAVLATDKQHALIAVLMDERQVPDTWVTRVKFHGPWLARSNASSLITALLALPKASPKAPAAPLGAHLLNDAVFRVVESKTGVRYAERLEGTRWLFSDDIDSLSEGTKITLEQAQRHGRATGVCACCGRTLTNSESIALGVGPICRGRL